jgi:serine/threonine protein kinase
MARCSVCGTSKSTPDADCPECSTERHDIVQLPSNVLLPDQTSTAFEAAPKTLQKDPLLGQTVGNYRIESVLGTGGMGTVYRAFHPGLDRAAAIKVLRAELSRDPGIVERFFREAKATNQIKHHGIVDIFDLGAMSNGRCYMVMALLEGESLEQYVSTHGALAEAVVTALGRQILSILAAAHQKKIIHRDLKPANIFLAKEPNGKTTVKLLDFGIAKILAPHAGLASTSDGTILGTPRYMPPEQARSPSSIDPGADFYSLGVVLYELATGCPLFSATNPIEMIQKHQTEQPIPPRKIRPQLSKEFEAAILCALSKDPKQRFKDCESFSHALYTKNTVENLTEEGDNISTLLDLNAGPSFAPEGGDTLDLLQPASDVKQSSQSAIAILMETPHPAFVATLPSNQPTDTTKTDLDPTSAPKTFHNAEPNISAIKVRPKKTLRFLWPMVLLLSFFSMIGGYLALQYFGSIIEENNKPERASPSSEVLPASTLQNKP